MILKKKVILILLLLFICISFTQCISSKKLINRKVKSSSTYYSKKGSNNVLGFGILRRLPGLWNGPVFSSTPAGSFDKWYVDFRPVSPGQISQYSILDAQTLN